MTARSEGGLEQAKKRDHKIMITDVAIDKVPYVEVQGFTPEQNRVFQQLNRDLLRIAKENNNSDEVACVYNLYTSEKTPFVFGDTVHVDLENDINVQMIKKKSYAFELAVGHNHPSTSNFSFADIDYFISNDYYGLMSVVSNQGEVYILLKTSNYDYDKIRKIQKKLLNKYSIYSR